MAQVMQTAKSPDGEKLARAVLDIMRALIGSMELELALLEKKEYASMEPVRKEKAKLIRDYQMNMGIVAEHPEAIKNAPEEIRGALRQVGLKLAKTSERNAIVLKAAITGTQSLLQTIITAARNNNRPTECYADPRKDPLMLGSYSPKCAPVAVNRTA